MFLIGQITSDPCQQQQLVLADGSAIALQIYFRSMQLGWFINQITYGAFILQGVRITNSPNILNQFKNQIPFGLACLSTSEREPSQIEDFSSGASKLYILSATEVEQYSAYLNTGVLA